MTHGAVDARSGLGWIALSTAFALPWLVEKHVDPWTSFYPDWLMAAACVALMVWVWIRSPSGIPWTRMAVGMAAVAAVPLAQSVVGTIAFPAEGLVAALYLLGCASAIVVGARAETAAPGRAGDALFAGLTLAALVSVGLQLYQWLDLNQLGSLVLQVPSNHVRPFANVGQPNLLATLLAWGLIGLWRAHERSAIGPTGGTLGAAFLLFGIAMTQSRTGWLEVALLAVVTLTRPLSLRRPPSRRVVVVLALWFVALVLCWPTLSAAVGLDPVLTLDQQVEAGKRPAIWRLGLDAVANRPWFGWGWNQGGEAHVALAAKHASIQVLIPYMHNIVIDLMLWTGIPIGIGLTLGFATWYLRRLREPGSAERSLMIVALSVLLLHAMFELPHGHAAFLLPAALMIGIVEARSAAAVSFVMPRWALGAALLGAILSLMIFAREMLVVEQDLLAVRMHAARIANLPPLGPPPRLVLMASHGELLSNLRSAPEPDMSDAQLIQFRRVAYRFPSTGNLLRLAEADVLNHRPVQAREALSLMCQLRPAAECAGASRFWNQMGTAKYPDLAASWPRVDSDAARIGGQR